MLFLDAELPHRPRVEQFRVSTAYLKRKVLPVHKHDSVKVSWERSVFGCKYCRFASGERYCWCLLNRLGERIGRRSVLVVEPHFSSIIQPSTWAVCRRSCPGSAAFVGVCCDRNANARAVQLKSLHFYMSGTRDVFPVRSQYPFPLIWVYDVYFVVSCWAGRGGG